MSNVYIFQPVDDADFIGLYIFRHDEQFENCLR